MKMESNDKNICMKCVHRNVCAFYEASCTSCNHFLCKDAVSRAESVEQIFAEIERNVTEIYNNHIFGNNDLYDTEKEAVMDFSADLSDKIESLKQKYTIGK